MERRGGWEEPTSCPESAWAVTTYGGHRTELGLRTKEFREKSSYSGQLARVHICVRYPIPYDDIYDHTLAPKLIGTIYSRIPPFGMLVLLASRARDCWFKHRVLAFQVRLAPLSARTAQARIATATVMKAPWSNSPATVWPWCPADVMGERSGAKGGRQSSCRQLA
jgi:hypothetical protein